MLYALGVAAFGAAGLGLRQAIVLLRGPAHPAAAPARVEPTHPGAAAGPPPAAAPDAATRRSARDPANARRARFDIVRIAPDGSAVIAGHAPADTTVSVTADGRPIGTAHVGRSGAWLLLPQARLRQGPLALDVRILGGTAGGTRR